MALLPGEAMSNVDAAWLHMEDRTNLMVITGVLSFYEKLDFAKLKELIEDRLLGFDRFRQRVVEPAVPLAGPRWVEDRYFNLRSHLQRVALPDPGGQDELQEMVSILMSTPLDMSKPLWQFQYIENYRGGSALVARVHHCIGDGTALVRVLLGMTDDSPQGSPAARRSRRRRKPLGGGFWLPEVVNEALWSVRRATGKVVDGTVETLLDPARAAAMAGQGIKAGAVLGRLALMPADPMTVLKGELGTAKRCAWSKILPLDDVKVFSKSVGATINDVLLSGVTGALRRYLVKRGEAVADGLDLRAIVPVNLRPEHEIDRLGNRFGLVFLALPVGLEDRAERLKELKRRMDGIKRSTEAVVTYGVLNALGTASASVESQAVRFFGSKATAVMTNVPGPRQELYLAGKAMRSMMFWVPQAAHLGLGVSILSYAGQVRLGIATDVGLAPDPHAIIEAFQDEMTAMLGGGA
ncbi:MAG TPA: wax ester/triacylglycerol synthase family O-acyltransferase [Methylomirabilota bacterium]|nr:wax ester/triacylglycerol synthase family O-acyltransferase [Methylomirabilota bacterium]